MNGSSPRRWILASGSPYRRQLLHAAGYEFETLVAAIDETLPDDPDELPAGLRHLAFRKAEAVRRSGAAGIILGADTVGLVGGRALGKAADRGEARRMLEAISGTTHAVLTGWCLLRTSDGLALGGLEETQIEMRAWTPAELEAYLDGGEWIGKCGAYGLQWPDDPFVTRLVGSATNVIGLPMERLAALFDAYPDFAPLKRA